MRIAVPIVDSIRMPGAKLTNDKIAAVIESAATTGGVPLGSAQAQWLKAVAKQGLLAWRELQACERELSRLVAADEKLSKYVVAVGAPTLAVIVTSVGDPRKHGSSGAFLKALGLNLKEQSSGHRQGELAITKRGPARARKWIFFWALRGVQRKELQGWYAAFTRVGASEKRHGPGEHRKMKGVVALMRKLCRGLWHAMKHEEEFDYDKLLQRQVQPKPRRPRMRHRRAARKARQRELAATSEST